MTLKYVCAAAALAGSMLWNGNVALAARGMGGASGSAMTTFTPPSSPTSGAIPRSPTSGALPPSPTSGALQSLPRSSLSILGQSLGASTAIPQMQVPLSTAQPALRTPYQPPCGAYPLPQC